jgi:hypothetical protein
MPRSARAMAHAPGQRREIQLIAAALRQVSEARISQETHGRKQLARLKAIVLPGDAAIHSLERSAARHRGLRRQATTVAAQALPTAAALTSHRSGRITTRSPTGGTAATRNLGRTIRLRTSPTRRRGHIPHLAVAIPLRHTPIPLRRTLTPHPHRVTAAAAGVAAIGAVVAAEEARTAAGAPPLTADTDLFANSSARPDLPCGRFLFRGFETFIPCQLVFQKSLVSALSF